MVWKSIEESSESSIEKSDMLGGPIVYWWKFKFGYQIENGYNVPVIGLK